MRILGIDPGLSITGYGIIEVDSKGNFKLIEAGVIRTANKEKLEVRINRIYNGIKSLIEEFHPGVLVLEKLYSHYRHPTTAILMGHVRGVICLAANQWGLSLVGYSSTRINKAVIGRGNASKYQIQRMMQNLLNLRSIPTPPDVSDALALAVAYAYISQKEGVASVK
ncbi:MAG: hypothetical protein AMJ78_04690 [Omnitrophica WOR_2 bacterium SM23_29]|nr:MAG: hypothetical protein AMJ78_04690 [Omnitrophica WOR_2 bacterium SM23_29]